MHTSCYVPSRIEDYALIGDCQTAALVSRGGSIDWLCIPRFDSGACFAALLGGPEHGRWTIAPKGRVHRVTRAYREGTLVLDTTFECDGGTAVLTDFMPLRERVPHLVRIVRCTRGHVRIATELVIRFDYGSLVPWVRREGEDRVAIAGPDSLRIQSEVPLHGENFTTLGEVGLREGQEVAFSATWHPSHVKCPDRIDERTLLRGAERDWRAWSSRCTYAGPWRDPVLRSLVTLKALTHSPTGGIVAAPTTSLPERLGGVRNWDYRFSWVRDASLLLMPLVGFLPVTDPRVQSTVHAIQRDLVTDDGFVRRYRNDRAIDGLPEGEGVFLPCSFWLVDDLALMGKREEAHRLFERLLGLCNDVGLVSEEYDPQAGRLLGNFPQAFTHVSLVNSARHVTEAVRQTRAVSSRTVLARA